MSVSGVLAEDLERIRSILAPYREKINEVVLFGSRATGAARLNSDIDLAIYGRLTDGDIGRLWTLFEESSISVSVDIVAYNQDLYLPLRQHIDQTKKVLFTADQLGHAVRKNSAEQRE